MGVACSEAVPEGVICSTGNCCTQRALQKEKQLTLEYAELSIPVKARHRVELAATPIGPWIPGLQPYHTSVIVAGVEYSFGPNGVRTSHNCESHAGFQSGGPADVMLLGRQSLTAVEILRTVQPLFKKGSYDLLRKNCNTFSDCMLFLLLGTRLDAGYRGLDALGLVVDATGLLQTISRGEYMPNPKADDFDLERIMVQLAKKKRSLELEAKIRQVNSQLYDA